MPTVSHESQCSQSLTNRYCHSYGAPLWSWIRVCTLLPLETAAAHRLRRSLASILPHMPRVFLGRPQSWQSIGMEQVSRKIGCLRSMEMKSSSLRLATWKAASNIKNSTSWYSRGKRLSISITINQLTHTARLSSYYHPLSPISCVIKKTICHLCPTCVLCLSER